jgi:hypothetical protein
MLEKYAHVPAFASGRLEYRYILDMHCPQLERFRMSPDNDKSHWKIEGLQR